MEKQTTYGPLAATILVPLLVLGCESFGPAAPQQTDGAAPAPTVYLECTGPTRNPDVSCAPGAKNGAHCTVDCCYPAGLVNSCGIPSSVTGFGFGYKLCTCPNGLYEWCTCVTPPNWPPLPAGGDCTPQGASSVPPPTGLKGAPCTKEWTTCFSSDAKGCVCLRDATTGNLNLQCGSQGTWFSRVVGVKTEY